MHYSLPRATGWNLLGYLYLIVASLISTPILLNRLGLAQFGQYSLILAAFVLVSSLNLGLPQAVTRALARDRQLGTSRQTIWGTSSLLFLAAGAVAGILAVVLTLALHLSPLLYLLIFVLCLTNSLVGHYLTLPQAEGHFGYYNSKTFVVGTANTFMAAYLSFLGQGILVILSAQLAAYLLTLLILAYFSLKFFPHPRAGRFSLPQARTLLRFGLKNQAGTFVGQIQAQYAKFVLSTLPAASLSAYVVASGLVQKMAGGVVQVASALYPAAASHADTPHLRRTYHTLQLLLLVLAVLGIGLYQLVGLPFLTWWLHSPSIVALVHQVLQVLVWYFAVLVLTPLPSVILDGRGYPAITSLFTLVTTVLEITLTLTLFPHYGLFAPVYASLLAVLATTPALLWVTEVKLSSDRVK